MSSCVRSSGSCAPYGDGSRYGDGELYCSDEFAFRSYMTSMDGYFRFMAVRVLANTNNNFLIEAIKPIVLEQRGTPTPPGAYQVDVDNACPQFLAIRIVHSGSGDFKLTSLRPILNVKKQRPVL